uniref:Uncharacterized protein n=1 Tax=mine drainage metagenome TaxID=410659 RepID=E6QNP9_9ZZZZ
MGFFFTCHTPITNTILYLFDSYERI